MGKGEMRQLEIVRVLPLLWVVALVGCAGDRMIDPGIDAFGFGNDKKAILRVRESVEERHAMSENELKRQHVDYLGIDSK